MQSHPTVLLKKLIAKIKPFKSVKVAYSGGVDSSVVAFAAQEALGNNSLAVTINSEFMSGRNLLAACECAKQAKLIHTVIDHTLISDDNICSNDSKRCYFCKKNIYSIIDGTIIDGSNADDPADRPGFIAANEAGTISPLRDIGASKDDIRMLATHLGLYNADKPADSCLATRIPTGTAITRDLLEKVETAETILLNTGATWCRARPCEKKLVLEYGQDFTPRASEAINTIVKEPLLKDFQTIESPNGVIKR